jgi:hypothetical protein
MAFPAMQSILVRGALQNVSVLYRNASYIADSIFPLINGLNYQTKVLKYSKQPWFALSDDLRRSEGTTAKRIDLKIDTQNLDPYELAAGARVTDELFFASNQPGNLPMQPITDSILLISDKIDLYRENLVAKTIFGTSDKYNGTYWADGAVGGTAPSGGAGFWAKTDTTNTFITDILAAKAKILSKTGVLPNTLMLDYSTFLALQNSQVILDRIRYTQTGVITEQLIAAALQLDNVVVGKAIFTSEKENKAGSINYGTNYIWNPDGKGKAFLFYRPAAAGMKQVSPGYQYRVAYDGETWRRMISYREEWNHQTIYEVSEWVDIAPVSTDVGYLWKQTISS